MLGAAFKPGTDDTRNSPALTVAELLAARGAHVTVFDPEASVESVPGVTASASVEECLNDADVVLHLTEWPLFRQLDPAALIGLVRRPVLIDGRLKLDAAKWRSAGWSVIQPGRPALEG